MRLSAVVPCRWTCSIPRSKNGSRNRTAGSTKSGSDLTLRLFQTQRFVAPLINHTDVIVFAEIFPSQQRNRHIAVFPEKVVESLQPKLVSLRHFCVRQEAQYFIFSNLITNCLSGIG